MGTVKAMSTEFATLAPSRALEQVPSPWPDTQLWLARLSCTDLQQLDLLRPDEAARAERFVFDADRRRYVAAHVALRLVLQDANAVAASPPYELGAYGKPALAGGALPHFSLSHSGDWALIGTSTRQEIGVDIESTRDLDDMSDLARRLFTPSERDDLERLRGCDRERGFFHAWTRKEACVKAVGTGLTSEVSSLDTGLASGLRTLYLERDGGACQIQVDSFDLEPQLVIAVSKVVANCIARRIVPEPALSTTFPNSHST